MVPIALALTTALIWGGVDFVAGTRSRTSGAVPVAALSQITGLVVIATVVAARVEPPPGAEYLLYGAAAGAASVVGLLALYQGMTVGLMSIVAPITATGAVVPVIVGVARGEEPSWIQGVGLLVAFLGVALASWTPGSARPAGRGRLAAGVGLALLGALGLGAFFVAFDAAAEGSIWWAVLLQRGTLVALLCLGALAFRARIAPRRRDLVAVAAIGVLDVIALTLLAEATTRGLISVVSVIASLYPVATVVLAQLILREHVTAAQRVGVAFAFAGVGLVTVG